MNCFTLSKRNLPIAKPRTIACRLDSKARLVLPLVIREELSVSKGGTILIEIQELSESFASIKLSKGKVKGLQRTARNLWEAREK